ncbi:MAG: hypothetical protein PVJ14_09905 [Chromatiales bacterium]|jgi:hypothetical protein
MTRQQKTLLITALVFAAPLLLAILLFMRPELVQLGTKNNGILVKPARPLDALVISVAGQPGDKSLLEGKWTWASFIEGPCGPACAEQLYKSRQVRLALGKDMDKGQRLLVQVGAPVALDPQLLEAHPDLIIANAEEDADWLSQFHLDGDSIETANIFLVDPLGNLMMYYPPEIEGPKILKDIQRLVRVSWIKPK